MKNFSIVLGFMILSCFRTSFGQKSEVTVGLRTGLNMASANASSASNLYNLLKMNGLATKVKPLINFHAGLVAQKKWNHLSIQSELIYSQYGAQIELGSNRAELKSNVIELPLLSKYTIGRNRAKFFVYTGPFVNYAVNGRFQLNGQFISLPVNIKEEINFQSEKERFSWGITSGLGVDWLVGANHLLTEIRYSYAIQSKIPTQVFLLGGTNIHAQLVSVSVGYLLTIK